MLITRAAHEWFPYRLVKLYAFHTRVLSGVDNIYAYECCNICVQSIT